MMAAVVLFGCTSEGTQSASSEPTAAVEPTATAMPPPTIAVEPTATAIPPPAVAPPRSTVLPTPAVRPAEDEIVIEPAGPFEAGQRTRLYVDPTQNIDLYNAGPLLCAAVAGGEELCDPRPLDNRGSMTSDEIAWIDVDVPRTHFGPTGHSDCAATNVACRLVFGRYPEGISASALLTFVDEPVVDPRVFEFVPAAEPGVFAFSADAEASDYDHVEQIARAAIGSSFDRDKLTLEFGPGPVCAFGSGEPPSGRDLLDEPPDWWALDWSLRDRISSCDWNGISAVGTTGEYQINRSIYTYHGWFDCAEVQCFVSIIIRWLHAMPDGSRLGSDEPIGFALVDAPGQWPSNERPMITITTPPPYEHGQEIVAVATNPRADEASSFAIATCVGTGNCVYPSQSLVDGVATISWKLPQTGCAPNRCYFAVNSGSEGLAPPAIAVVPLAE